MTCSYSLGRHGPLPQLLLFSWLAGTGISTAADTWDDRFGVPNLSGAVLSVDSTTGGRVAIGGIFSGNAFDSGGFLNANKVALWNGRAWSRTGDGPDNGPGGTVRAVEYIGEDLYVGGEFFAVNGVPFSGIARWRNGAWWPLGNGISEGVSGAVWSLAEKGAVLFVGGRFSSTPNGSANNIAAWDGFNWSSLGSGVSGGSNPTVITIAVAPDNSIYVGGNFTHAGGLAANGIARWDGVAWSTLGSGVAGSGGVVYAIAIGPAGEVVAGGRFDTAGGTTASNLAVWNGSTWSAVGGGVGPSGVRGLAFDGNDLWVTGAFESTNGQFLRGIAVRSGGVWKSPSWNGLVSGATSWGDVPFVRRRPEGVYLAGSYRNEMDGSHFSGVTLWNGTTFQALHRGFLSEGGPGKLSVAADNVMVSGSFREVAGKPAQRLARWDGAEWQLYGSSTNNGVPGEFAVYANAVAAAPDGTGYLGGEFATVANVAARNIAYWNGTNWSPLGSGVQGVNNSAVRSLALTPDGRLFVGGRFTDAGGEAVNHVAAWNGTAWSALGSGLRNTADPERTDVLSLVWSGDRLYAGGNFTQAGELQVNRIAYWDGDNWQSLGSGLEFPGFAASVGSLAVRGFELFAGGDFVLAGGVSAQRIARWSPSQGWSSLGDGFNSTVEAIATHGGRLFVGGNFTQSGAKLISGLAEWVGGNWQIVGGGLSGDSRTVYSIGAAQTNLYFTGGFERSGSVVSTHFARLQIDNAPPTITWDSPTAGAYVLPGASMLLAVTPADLNGSVASVQFFTENDPSPIATRYAAPWEFNWSNPPTGEHRLIAVATDNSGASAWSLVRRAHVLPPGSSLPPVVTLLTPTNGANFKISGPQLLSASASDPDGTVAQVKFLANGSVLGTVNTSPWEMNWPDLQPGSYQLRAIATDNTGMSSTSAVATVTVRPPNVLPELRITYPGSSDELEAPAPILLGVQSGDSDGRLTSVEFRLNDELLVRFTDDLLRYSFYHTWTPSVAGDQLFEARSTDNDGGVTVRTQVLNVLPYNQPPAIVWTGPADGTTVPLPNNITLSVEPTDPDGTITRVEWLRSGFSLGMKTNAPWVFPLRNLTEDTYELSARATDNRGKQATTPTIFLTATNDPAQVPRYLLVDLDPPLGNGGEAFAVNYEGAAAYTVMIDQGYPRSFRYLAGQVIDLGATVSPAIDRPIHVTGINDAGAVVGYVEQTPFQKEGFLWTTNGLTWLGMLTGSEVYNAYSRANDINNDGWIVGASLSPASADRGFLWRNGNMTEIASPDLMSCEPFAVNDRGEVVGGAWEPGVDGRAFMYDETGGFRYLAGFGDSTSFANDINSRGQVTGVMSTGNDGGIVHSFVWSSGVYIKLGLLGGSYAKSTAINDRGQVVGSAGTIHGREHAFLWQDCAMIDLNQTITNENWELRVAHDINNRGWIVGYGYRDAQPYPRPFLLIPENEQATLTVGSPIRFEDGRFQLCVPAPPNTTYRLDGSVDLKNWLPISTNFVPEGVLDFRDPNTENFPTRFYRAVILP